MDSEVEQLAKTAAAAAIKQTFAEACSIVSCARLRSCSWVDSLAGSSTELGRQAKGRPLAVVDEEPDVLHLSSSLRNELEPSTARAA